ncbi:protein N-terminal glutamine amidohydrolase isoform X1 [Echeneis naucrates]|uniref:protein N-terminal glutamine amidohydrolase isoform X1 n=1 Tax=Echeneis naucrates TaxID=173247 RepID=UPI00111454B3|nr:protein N-terminal glutamine amidohydrolase isoform X1 [Echeneis naucrates]
MKGERIIPSRENCVYTSCYCEENVWKLCEFVKDQNSAHLEHLSVIFISNENRMVLLNVFHQVPLWRQKSGHGDRPVIWDYHVILLQAGFHSDSLVYDLDSELSFPCSLKLYATEALRSDCNIRSEYHRRLRVIPAESFMLNFASDRSHMKTSDGSWRMPPPPYPPIHTTESHMNLDDFISMDPAVGWGVVFSLEHFLLSYTGDSSSTTSSSPLLP